MPNPRTSLIYALTDPFMLCRTGLAGAVVALNICFLVSMAPGSFPLWMFVNAIFLAGIGLVRWRYAAPLAELRRMMQQTAGALGGALVPVPMHATALLQQMAMLSSLATQQSLARAELKHELESTRQVLAQCTLQQQAMMRSANREIIAQYQAVLSYANYLDEHIHRKTADPELRYDFDDVCESSFTLKLVAVALELLRQQDVPHIGTVCLGAMMQQTMFALAPSLDRRAMRLTTVEVDESVMAATDAGLLTHVIWMMLLGMIRYAADESTLRMRCLYDRDRKRALLSIVVSELAPGRMTHDERAAHLVRQMQHGSSSMFAETIKLHGHVQLAELLLNRLDAHISVVPLSAYACEICLSLPAPVNL